MPTVDQSRSQALSERAKKVLPSGVTHDMRFLRPFPIYVERSQGAHKWDVDGNEYIDYWMGHGALLLGHRHPDVIGAIERALASATHVGGCHPIEVEWAEKVVELVPSAKRVRFTSSGTEATMLAIRLARAFTGRDRIVKFEGHFHGWHDAAAIGVTPPFEEPVAGIPQVLDQIVTVLPPDADVVRAALSDGDVAAIILEPTGASMGVIPISPDLLGELRHACDATQTLLIFDEVITGFRFSPGGVQELTGILPDLTCLGKVLAGGLPGGAVAGPEEILDRLAFSPDPGFDRMHKVQHTGTFNANPTAAAAGVATLRLVADGAAGSRASELARQFRDALQSVIVRHGARWSVFGESSIFHWLPIAIEELTPGMGDEDRGIESDRRKRARSVFRTEEMRNALLQRGIDFPGYEGWLSASHSEMDIERTVEAFDDAIGSMDGSDG
ncbi:MAG: aspartate aminotransferase family protein [Actinomycetota bacterium]